MAVRIMGYVSQLAWQIAREHKKHELPEGRLPPILPIVLYNGAPVWNAPTDVAECFIDPPEELRPFLPRAPFLLLDERHLLQSPFPEVRNFAVAVFRMETDHGRDNVPAVVEALARMLCAPDLAQLRRAFNLWIKWLLMHRAPPSMIEGIENIRDVFEEYDKMEVVYEDWLSETRREALREGEQKGRLEGEQKGRLEGEAKLLLRQLHRRFDPLPEWAQARVRAADAAQLEAWADALLDAGSLADVFGAPPGGA